MVLLTTFLIPVCLILSFSLSNLAQIKEYNIAFGIRVYFIRRI